MLIYENQLIYICQMIVLLVSLFVLLCVSCVKFTSEIYTKFCSGEKNSVIEQAYLYCIYPNLRLF